MKQLKELTQDEYKKLKKSDMLTILYPEATGDYYKDTNDFYIKFPLAKDWNISVDISRNNTYLHFAESGWYKIGEKILYVKEGSSEVCNEHDEIRKAKPSEVEAHLIEEAKRRGYKKGVRIKVENDAMIYTLTDPHFSYEYLDKYDELITKVVGQTMLRTVCIYSKGKWTEIIKDESIKIGQGANEYEVKFKPNGIDVGCKHISRGDVEKLKSFYLLVHSLGFSKVVVDTSYEKMIFIGKGFEPIHVTLDEIQSIIEKIHDKAL